jgi:phosphate transport system protein
MREEFRRELEALRESVLRMATQVESQIDDALTAMRTRDAEKADQVRLNDQQLNELFRQIRERCFSVIATQAPVARDLRTLMGIIYIATELERMGDYAVRIARMTTTLCGLPAVPLRAEFGLMGDAAIRQVHDILDALIEQDEARAREVAAKDDEIDRLYHRVFDDLISDMSSGEGVDPDEALRTVTLMLVAHNLERIADRVTNVAEDIVFLQTGQVVELG